MSEFPVSISDGALAQARRMLSRSQSESSFLRLGIKGGGCSGFEYFIQVDERRLPNDLTTVIDGVEFVCDAKSAEFLFGSTLVASGNLIGGGLKFENPNAARSCGCGSSFTPKPKS